MTTDGATVRAHGSDGCDGWLWRAGDGDGRGACSRAGPQRRTRTAPAGSPQSPSVRPRRWWCRTSRSRCRARTRSRPGSCCPEGTLAKNSHPEAGVLWLHWLGEINGDRSEYLSEAVTLAGQGVVSVLPAGLLPVGPEPRRHRRRRHPRREPGRRDARRSRPAGFGARGRRLPHRAGRSRLRRHVRRVARRLRRPHLDDGAAGAGLVDGQLVRPVLAGARGRRSGRVPRPLRRPEPRRPHRAPRRPGPLPVGRPRRLHRPGRARRLRREQPRSPGEALRALRPRVHATPPASTASRSSPRSSACSTAGRGGRAATVTRPGDGQPSLAGFRDGTSSLLNQRFAAARPARRSRRRTARAAARPRGAARPRARRPRGRCRCAGSGGRSCGGRGSRAPGPGRPPG